jgi:hypothetical protein
MKLLINAVSLLSLLACTVPIIAQFHPEASFANDREYFTHILTTIGSPDASAETLTRREKALVAQLDLNAADAALLHSVAQTFQGEMTSLKLTYVAFVSARAGILSDEDRRYVDGIGLQREQLILTLIARLEARLTADGVSKIRKLKPRGH